jgi:hypothetical protein
LSKGDSKIGVILLFTVTKTEIMSAAGVTTSDVQMTVCGGIVKSTKMEGYVFSAKFH